MACFMIALPAGGGSVVDYFSALGRELASRGHRVIILIDGQRRDEVSEGSNPSILTWPSKRPTHWPDAVFLHRLIGRHRPSCIVGNFSAVSLCTLVGWLDRVPVRIAWIHTSARQIDQDWPVPPLKRAYQVRRRRLILRLATLHMAVSEPMKAELQSMYGVPARKIRVHHFLIADPPATLPPIRRGLVVCAGRQDPSKGQDVLVRAIPAIKAARPDAVVEFLGGGSTLERNKALAASLQLGDACRFLGALSHRETLEKMASAAVVAVPSFYDAFPLVNVEAASVGTPVVGSAVGGMGEMVVDGKTGFLVPPGDSAALSERIISILGDDALREKLGLAARELFRSSYSMRNMSKHADLFESFVGAGSS